MRCQQMMVTCHERATGARPVCNSGMCNAAPLSGSWQTDSRESEGRSLTAAARMARHVFSAGRFSRSEMRWGPSLVVLNRPRPSSSFTFFFTTCGATEVSWTCRCCMYGRLVSRRELDLVACVSPAAKQHNVA